jgi:hypothetical protein
MLMEYYCLKLLGPASAASRASRFSSRTHECVLRELGIQTLLIKIHICHAKVVRIRNNPQLIPCGEHDVKVFRKISVLIDIVIYKFVFLSKRHILGVRSFLAQVNKSNKKFCIREIAAIEQSYLGKA